MIIGSKKIKSYALILLFSFFSAFAMNVVLVDLSPVFAEDTITSGEDDGHGDSPKNSFLFLDEVHHEELVIFAPMAFYISFNSTLTLYRNPYLNSPTIPPHV